MIEFINPKVSLKTLLYFIISQLLSSVIKELDITRGQSLLLLLCSLLNDEIWNFPSQLKFCKIHLTKYLFKVKIYKDGENNGHTHTHTHTNPRRERMKYHKRPCEMHLYRRCL